MEISKIEIRWNLYKSHSEKESERTQFRKTIFQLRETFLNFVIRVENCSQDAKPRIVLGEVLWRLTAAQLY